MPTPEVQNAVAVVAKACELYLNTLDELARGPTHQSIQMAINIIEKAIAQSEIAVSVAEDTPDGDEDPTIPVPRPGRQRAR